MKKLNLLAVMMVVLSLMLSSCGPSEPKEVKIGVLLPLTGPLSEFGEGFRKAGDMAEEQLDAAGLAVELVYADTETSPMPGADAASNLVDVEGVKVLIGAASSGVSQAVAESVAIPNEIPEISYASTSPMFTLLPADEGKDFFFRTCPSDALQGVALGMMAADEGYEKVGVLYVNNAYGEGLAEQFKESFEHRGGTVTGMVPHDEKPSPTYVSELKKAAEGDPEALLAISYPGQATTYVKEAIENELFETFLWCDGTKSIKMPEEIGAEQLAGTLGTAPAASEAASPEVFKEEYETKYGEAPPLPFMENVYDAIVVARLAAAKVEAEGKEITSVNIRDMLREVANPDGESIGPGSEQLEKAAELIADGEAINYEGAVGLDFDEHGDMISPIEIWEYVAEEPYIEQVRLMKDIPVK